MLELNSQIAREDPRSPTAGGGSWFLIYEHEEAADAKIIKRLFQLLPSDVEHLDKMDSLLKKYCFENKPLFTYDPPSATLEKWCDVVVTKREKEKLVYMPMADTSLLPPDTQKMINNLEEDATKSG